MANPTSSSHVHNFHTLHPPSTSNSSSSSNINPPQSRNHGPLRKLRSVQNLSSTSPYSPSPNTLLAQQRQRLRNVTSFTRDHSHSAHPAPLSSIHPPTHVSSTTANSASQIQPPPAVTPSLAHAAPSSIPLSQPHQQLGVSKSRHRANSDAALGAVSTSGPISKKQAAAKRIISGFSSSSAASSGGKKTSLDILLREGPPRGDIAEGLQDLRYLVLTDGVGSNADGMSSLRIYIWLILLSAPVLKTDDYLSLVHRGPSPAYNKIRNDTFRTLATDPLFRRRVTESSLIRMLNAVAWRLQDARESSSSPENTSLPPLTDDAPRGHSSRLSMSEASDSGPSTAGIYVQGMNVLAAPFLYAAHSEAEAFIAFHTFVSREVPSYIQGSLDGVHRGLKLVDEVLAIIDPKLSAHLLSKGMNAELYAFPSVLTLCACTPPLPEVLHLWDFLMAYGVHLNILCVVAQLVMMRDEILLSNRYAPVYFSFPFVLLMTVLMLTTLWYSPNKVLRVFPPLQASKIKMITISLVKKIPESVYEEIVMHAK
jgi:cell cycle arrest protein BUB2